MIDTIVNLLKKISNNVQHYQVRYEELGREHFKIRFKHNDLDISIVKYQNDSIIVIVYSDDIIGKPVKIDITNSDEAYQLRNVFQEVNHKCQDYVINLLKSIK